MRLSAGFVKTFVVWSYSTRMPLRPLPSSRTSTLKNAVMSATRAACCMLCVTITIVYSVLSSWIRSSMREVEIGSSAEAGSSIRITSGSTASARAMQSRCCWPPERPSAFSFSRSLTSSQSAACRSVRSTRSSSLSFIPRMRGPKAMLS